MIERKMKTISNLLLQEVLFYLFSWFCLFFVFRELNYIKYDYGHKLFMININKYLYLLDIITQYPALSISIEIKSTHLKNLLQKPTLEIPQK
jgi:hypothetical protein